MSAGGDPTRTARLPLRDHRRVRESSDRQERSATATTPDAEFERHRGVLLGLGYRLLGTMWDAEDIVQEAFVRWMRTDRSVVEHPRSFLVTVVTRLALDQLRSARVAREVYTGPWLPEPALTEPSPFGPLDTVEQRDSISLATLHLMERLTPPERAVFVLREAFELPYDDVAAVLGASAATCRQLYRRARQRLGRDEPRFQPSRQEHERLLRRFLDAARDGDLAALTEILSADVVSWNDGGGRVRSARRPILGRAKVIRFLLGLTSRYPLGSDHQLVEANGAVAAVVPLAGQDQLIALDVRDGVIRQVFGVNNPDKLRFLRAQLARRP